MIISNRFKDNNISNANNPYKGEQLNEINIVKDKINKGDLALAKTNCPCGGSDFGVIATIERHGVALDTVICDDCGSLRFKNYLIDSSLSEFYINHYQKMYGRLENIPRYFKRQQTYGKRIYKTYKNIFSKGDNILEIGCGAGGALKYFKQQGLNIFGCEYSKTLVDHANKEGLESVFQGSLFDIQNSIDKGFKFKLIYIHHVFEHVSDPVALLEKCRSMLEDEGKLVIGVPYFLAIDSYENPGCNLMPFLHIAHIYNFTSDCFESLADLANLGYKRVTLSKFYSTPWAVQPELWGEFIKDPDLINQSLEQGSNKVGEDIIRYLKQTENDYLNNHCAGVKNKQKNKSLKSRLKGFLFS